MALNRYGDFRVEVFYFDSPCTLSATMHSVTDRRTDRRQYHDNSWSYYVQ